MASFEDILAGLDGDMAALKAAFEEFVNSKKGDDKKPKAKKGKAAKAKPEEKVEAHAEAEKKGDDKEPEKKVEAHAEAEKKGDAGEKHITRISPVMAEQLKTALTAAEIPCDEKQFRNLKDEFRGYVNELTDDDYKKSSLPDHMRDFANLKKEDAKPEKKEKPARKPRAKKSKEEAEAEPEKKEEAKAETKKKPGRKPKDEKEEKPEKKEEPKAASGGGAATVKPVILTLTELMERSERVYPDQQVGLFWDPDAGEMVTGPEEDADEDMEEEEFEGKTHAVGQKTGRVYAQDDEGLDIFVGFKGVGKFKHM